MAESSPRRGSHLFAAIRCPGEPKVLLLRSDRRWRLPHAFVRDPVWSADAQTIVPALERRLATRLWLLRRIHPEIYELEPLEPSWEGPAHGRWFRAAELSGLQLADEEQRPVLESFLAGLEQSVPSARPPWARTGWRAEVLAWIEAEAARLGHTVVSLEQVKQWSISSVLRIGTDGPDLYLKAPARLPLFVEEAVVTARLAARFADHVPAPLAVEPERGWLLLPAFEELGSWDDPLERRQEMLRRFAALQRRTVDLVDDLIADGCLDRRLGVLESQLDGLLDDPGAMARLEESEVAELRRLRPGLKELCRRLAGLGIPATLVHGDLHMLNVACLHADLVYFDWTDACVAHPFIDLLSLGWEPDEAVRAALLDAYLEPWRGVVSDERLDEAVAVAGVVIPLHHAVSYRQIAANVEPVARSELDATHEFLRRVLATAPALLE